MNRRWFRLPVVLLVIVAGVLFSAPAGAELNAERMALAERAINDAVERRQIPGAVLLVGNAEKTLYLKAFGNRAVKPESVPMTADTVFDLASMSKTIGCATSVMILADRGKIRVSDPVARYIPAFGANGKENITIEQLLLHRGGLIPDNPMADYSGNPQQSMEKIYALKPLREPGTSFWYTDVGYIVLGKLVEVVDGRPLDRFAREEIFEPLGMNETGYLISESLKQRSAPTEQREARWMQGEVHDPRAYALGGVAGHAGMFATAEDVAKYCRMILKKGEVGGKRILSAQTLKDMTLSRSLPDGTGVRTYGFDVNTSYSGSPRGDRFEAGTTFGHTGFTGTMFWIDPKNDLYVVLLTNRVHPDGKGEVGVLRRRVATFAAEAALGPAKPKAGPSVAAALGAVATASERAPSGAPVTVMTGIDMLKKQNFKPLDGRKVALITNHTGRDREGNRTVDLLAAQKNFQLVKLFSPEHGLYGTLDEKVGHTTDPKTGLKVYSLYGETRKPNEEMLEGVDTLVFDIQDVGARFYTYSATMGLCMEAAAKRKIRMVVLDRPNPITGLTCDGPIAEKQYLSFTAYGPIPVLHGMTFGELAKLFNSEYGINCDLQVIEMENWTRGMWWDETGLTWVNPSPNMRNLNQALLYTGVCLIEATNVSVGRGTDQPFEIVGAPWIDGQKLSAAMNASRLPGVRFYPIEFTPTASKHAKQQCGGIYIVVTDRLAVEPVKVGVTLVWQLKKLFGDKFEFAKVVRLMHSASTLKAIEEAKDPSTLPAVWKDDLEKFKDVRAKYLIYR